MAESESMENESENRSRKSSVSSDSSRSSRNHREHSSESEDFEDKEESSRSKPETKEKRFSKRISKEKEKTKKPSNAEHPREHHSRGSNGEEAGKTRSRKNKSKTSTSVSGDESSRRDRDWNSSGAGGSEHEMAERQLKWQKLEPKFEPRYTLYKQNQTVLDGMKRDTAYYYEHRRKIAEAKPMVDNRPPPIFSHIYCNMKKLKIQQDRQDAIEKDNQLLLARLVNAMTTTRIDNWNNSTDIHHQNPKKQKQKQEELMQIEAENRRLFNRIDKNNRKSSVSTEAEQFHAPKQHQSQHRSRAVPKK